MTQEEFNEKADQIVRDMAKSFGAGSVMRPSSHPIPVDVIPTGILNVDAALGIGGVPKGRITEIYGMESSAKTSLALSVVANCQKMGGMAAYVDAEHALDLSYAQNLGVDIEDLLISQPDSGEQALEIVEALIRTGQIDCVVVDSVAALTPRAEIEGEMGQSFIGLQARLMSQAMRKLTAVTHNANCALIFINQIREKVGVMYGSPETTPGGRALRFYCSVRIELRRGETINHGSNIEGARVRVKIVKNKLAPPFKETLATVYFGKGLSRTESILDAGIESGVIKKSGAWVVYGEQKWHGRQQLMDELSINLRLVNDIEEAIKNAIPESD